MCCCQKWKKQDVVILPTPTYSFSGLFLSLNLHIQYKDLSLMDSISPMSLILCAPSPLHHLPAHPCNSFPASGMHPHMRMQGPHSLHHSIPSALTIANSVPAHHWQGLESHPWPLLPSPASSLATFHSPIQNFEFLKRITLSLYLQIYCSLPTPLCLATASQSLFS